MREYIASDAIGNVMPKEPFGQALYLPSQPVSTICWFTSDDGPMPIDNNDAEQLMKQVALGSKNWMFIGSVDAGGYRAADLMSLVSGASGMSLDVFPFT